MPSSVWTRTSVVVKTSIEPPDQRTMSSPVSLILSGINSMSVILIE